MNIPARYCTGYLSDIVTPKPWAAWDFAGWIEAYIGGHWRTFDPRDNVPRIGRVLIAQGRDGDVAKFKAASSYSKDNVIGEYVKTIASTSMDYSFARACAAGVEAELSKTATKS